MISAQGKASIKALYDSVLDLVKYVVRVFGITDKIKKQVRMIARGTNPSA